MLRLCVPSRLPEPAPSATTERSALWRRHLGLAMVAIVAAACAPLQQEEPPAAERPAPPAPVVETARPPPTPPETRAPVRPAPPRLIALLLPFSDAEKPLAEAVRDGFLAAHFAASGERPAILLLDASGPVATSAYQAAIDAGAGVIVGPLLKQAVAEIAAIAGPVTTLALNFLEPGAPTAPNFYQYSLAPEDEARQAAARAAAEGQSRALALAPDNEWGRRMLGAFIPAVEAQGGTVADYYLYDTAETDFTAPIQRLLRLDESRARHRELAANLGVSLGFEPRRRDDVDFIFLAANVAHGRLIWPQLRFLYAGDLPTYAPSAINQPGARGNSDLDGVRFADAPLLLGTESQGVALAGTLATRWPANTVGLLRFYAMGFDAYALARDIAEGITPERPGLTGRLWTDPQRRVHRDMPWAQFRDGGIVLLPSTATTPAASP